MTYPTDWSKSANPKRLPVNKLAVAYGLPPYTPHNVVRMYGGALLANNQAHTIKNDYDTNNPTTPLVRAKQADRSPQHAEPLSPPKNIQPR